MGGENIMFESRYLVCREVLHSELGFANQITGSVEQNCDTSSLSTRPCEQNSQFSET